MVRFSLLVYSFLTFGGNAWKSESISTSCNFYGTLCCQSVCVNYVNFIHNGDLHFGGCKRELYLGTVRMQLLPVNAVRRWLCDNRVATVNVETT